MYHLLIRIRFGIELQEGQVAFGRRRLVDDAADDAISLRVLTTESGAPRAGWYHSREHTDNDYRPHLQITGAFDVASAEPEVSGAATVDEAATYALDLTPDADAPGTVTEWEIDWGDGTVETLSGSSLSATHIYADGPTTYEQVPHAMLV